LHLTEMDRGFILPFDSPDAPLASVNVRMLAARPALAFCDEVYEKLRKGTRIHLFGHDTLVLDAFAVAFSSSLQTSNMTGNGSDA